METLSDFKKYLATPGARIRLISVGGRTPAPALSGWRTVAKLQTNAVAFTTENKSGKSWLYYPKAAACSFEGNTANLDGLIYEIEEN